MLYLSRARARLRCCTVTVDLKRTTLFNRLIRSPRRCFQPRALVRRARRARPADGCCCERHLPLVANSMSSRLLQIVGACDAQRRSMCCAARHGATRRDSARHGATRRDTALENCRSRGACGERGSEVGVINAVAANRSVRVRVRACTHACAGLRARHARERLPRRALLSRPRDANPYAR